MKVEKIYIEEKIKRIISVDPPVPISLKEEGEWQVIELSDEVLRELKENIVIRFETQDGGESIVVYPVLKVTAHLHS